MIPSLLVGILFSCANDSVPLDRPVFEDSWWGSSEQEVCIRVNTQRDIIEVYENTYGYWIITDYEFKPPNTYVFNSLEVKVIALEVGCWEIKSAVFSTVACGCPWLPEKYL